MKTFHVNPEEAVQIHLDIRARRSLAMHWGTFPLTAESPGEPPERLAAAVQSHGLAPTAFTAIALGTTVTVHVSMESE
jgi:N-acyl-phosphatidylethanolamine-hydrolysing phospholipase D